MLIFKTRDFSKWAGREGLSDDLLITAVAEMEAGLVDASLGGNVYKKRVAIGAKGKSGGVRTLLAYQSSNKAFFMYGFAKNARANISRDEKKALKLLAKTFIAYSVSELNKAVKAGALFEVENDE